MTCCNSIPTLPRMRGPARNTLLRLLHQLRPAVMPAPLTPSSALPTSGPSKRHGACPKTSTPQPHNPSRLIEIPYQPTASTTPPAHFTRSYRTCHTDPRPSPSLPTPLTLPHN